MKIAIRYYSETTNTKKVAQAMAKELKIEALPINDGLDHQVDILFLGCPLHGFDIDQVVKDFINNLDERVGKVAIFSTSAIAKNMTYKRIGKLLKKKDIKYFDNHFYVRAQFKKMNIGKPDENDLEKAKEYAKGIVGGDLI